MTNRNMPSSSLKGARQPSKLNTPDLHSLAAKCSYIAIENGKLILESASGKPIPSDWFNEHSLNISIEIARLLNIPLFRYESFNRGRYGKQKASGVSLQFINLSDTKKGGFAVFNAVITRERTTVYGKAGDPLPKKQFRAGEKSGFYEFWVNAGLKLPPSLTRFADYMGNLKNVLFTGDYKQKPLKPEELDKNSVLPLTITYPQIVEALGCSHNSHTTRAQDSHKVRTTSSHKETPQSQTPQGLQANPTTGENQYGKRLQGSAVMSQSNRLSIDPKSQTDDEWFYDYDFGCFSDYLVSQ